MPAVCTAAAAGAMSQDIGEAGIVDKWTDAKRTFPSVTKLAKSRQIHGLRVTGEGVF
jgi:hypothetical protein